jgi:hypothetical protein
MFHEWDKQLRKWLIREVHHWHCGDNTSLQVWSVNFHEIIDLLESLGWNLRSKDYFRKLDACRLVVNVYKHGDGKSLAELNSSYPEYLEDPLGGVGGLFSDPKYRNHTHLKVSDEQFQAFAEAILAFWRDVPESVVDSQVDKLPPWFQKSIAKDRAHSQVQSVAAVQATNYLSAAAPPDTSPASSTT